MKATHRTTLFTTLSFGLAFTLVAPVAHAQSGNAGGECSGGLCGAPEQTGGGGGCGGGGSVLINFTDVGDTYQYADDYDADGFEDDFDNCPFAANFDQLDSDGDLVGDVCDSCLSAANPNQLDTDADGAGDACDTDMDNDGFLNLEDNCPLIANPSQGDNDIDLFGNACDPDDDNDGLLDNIDTCPFVANPDNIPLADSSLCDIDTDGDGLNDSIDLCIEVPSALADLSGNQPDIDLDGIGDVCDADIDGDGLSNADDNCPNMANEFQVDTDRDGVGDMCDARACYVIRRVEDIRAGNPLTAAQTDNCLDPELTFTVMSVPYDLAQVGEERRLPLFANRDSVPLRYEWRLVDRPEGSTARIQNARGSATTSEFFEYRYLQNNVASFTPDQPGEYTFQVNAEMVFDDPQFPGASSDNATFTMTVEGDAVGGCSSLPGQTNTAVMWLLVAGAGIAAMRRRRA